VRTCWGQPQPGENVAEGAKRMAGVGRRREKRETTQRNGYEEIPPPVIPP